MPVTGPDFVALQVRDTDEAAQFYEKHLGLRRAKTSLPPGAVLFDTKPIPFAVRETPAGVDLDSAFPRPGFGIALWLHCDVHARFLRDSLAKAGVQIVQDITSGPFGNTFTFADPNGYAITVHDGI